MSEEENIIPIRSEGFDDGKKLCSFKALIEYKSRKILIKCQRNNSISDCVENRILDNEDQDNIIFDMIDICYPKFSKDESMLKICIFTSTNDDVLVKKCYNITEIENIDTVSEVENIFDDIKTFRECEIEISRIIDAGLFVVNCGEGKYFMKKVDRRGIKNRIC